MIDDEFMTVRKATKLMFQRYEKINNDFMTLCNPPKSEVKGLIEEGISQAYKLPIDKLSRWLGYVQCSLISEGLVTIDGERDFSRPLFHNAYFNEGLDIPPKIDV